MKAYYFPKALIYKEWRQQRLYLLIAIVAMLLWSVSRLSLLHGGQPHVWSSIVEQWMSQVIYGNSSTGTVNYTASTPVVNGINFFVAVMLGVTSFSGERNHGALAYTLAGPVERKILYRVKFAMGAVWMIGVLLFIWLLLVGANMIGGYGFALSAMSYWLIANVIIVLVVYATAMTVTNVFGNALSGGIVTLVMLGLPAVVAEVVLVLSHVKNFSKFAQRLSPWTYVGAHSSTTYTSFSAGVAHVNVVVYTNTALNLGFGVWFLVWIIAMYFLGQWLFDRVQIENLSNFYMFPVLWKWTMLGVAIFIGFIFAVLTMRQVGPQDLAKFLGLWGLWTVALWGVVLLFMKIYRRRRLAGN